MIDISYSLWKFGSLAENPPYAIDVALRPLSFQHWILFCFAGVVVWCASMIPLAHRSQSVQPKAGQARMQPAWKSPAVYRPPQPTVVAPLAYRLSSPVQPKLGQARVQPVVFSQPRMGNACPVQPLLSHSIQAP